MSLPACCWALIYRWLFDNTKFIKLQKLWYIVLHLVAILQSRYNKKSRTDSMLLFFCCTELAWVLIAERPELGIIIRHAGHFTYHKRYTRYYDVQQQQCSHTPRTHVLLYDISALGCIKFVVVVCVLLLCCCLVTTTDCGRHVFCRLGLV